ncbi:dihydrolipoyllysine-residue acetyltransferase component 5 of pyruvate dehydrogenase complex, chloroplastic, partial [Tanacetum coccineum]
MTQGKILNWIQSQGHKLSNGQSVVVLGLAREGGWIVSKDVEAAAAVGSDKGAVSKNMMVESLGVPTFRVGYTITTHALDALYKKITDGKSFTYTSNINIAVAVAIDGGLITPVLQNADKVDIYSLSKNERVG